MRCVTLVARCLAGGAVVSFLSAGLAPINAQEWPTETTSLTRPTAPAVLPTTTKKVTCAGVIGTSRTIVAGADTPQRIGRMQYRTSLPLKDHEVVLTFDDGPIRTYTPRVLDILAANCVKATYFLVGSMAHAYPRLVRRIYNEGHSIGTHSQHHPLTFARLTTPAIAREVNAGIASVQAAAGDPRAVAPFFRVPGLLRSRTVDSYLAARSLMEWSADEVADDWRHGITAEQIVRLAMRRIAARDHRGVLLLHDIHPATVKALPMLLATLKKHGYRIVHIVPAGVRPKSVPPLPAKMVAGTPARRVEARSRPPLIRHIHRHRRAAQRYRGQHRARLSHAQSLSALAHPRHRKRLAAGDTQASFDW